MWLCEGKLKVKTSLLQLPSASQKRACLSPNVVFIIFGEKHYGSCLCDVQISYEMVSNAHVRQLTVSL